MTGRWDVHINVCILKMQLDRKSMRHIITLKVWDWTSKIRLLKTVNTSLSLTWAVCHAVGSTNITLSGEKKTRLQPLGAFILLLCLCIYGREKNRVGYEVKPTEVWTFCSSNELRPTRNTLRLPLSHTHTGTLQGMVESGQCKNHKPQWETAFSLQKKGSNTKMPCVAYRCQNSCRERV